MLNKMVVIFSEEKNLFIKQGNEYSSHDELLKCYIDLKGLINNTKYTNHILMEKIGMCYLCSYNNYYYMYLTKEINEYQLCNIIRFIDVIYFLYSDAYVDLKIEENSYSCFNKEDLIKIIEDNINIKKENKRYVRKKI